MKTFLFKIVSIFFIYSSLAQADIEELSAHEYAERTHNQIIEIIQTQEQLFEENPDLFTKLISEAFSPIVDFKRIARNVMGKYSNQASGDQMEAFSRAFEKKLIRHLFKYSRRIQGWKN